MSEDASFEEISAATKALEKEYAGDVKKKIRIGVTKDKIMDLRLKQRECQRREPRAIIFVRLLTLSATPTLCSHRLPPLFTHVCGLCSHVSCAGVGGSLNIAADARMMDMASDRADEMRKRTTKFEAPSWANGLVLPPDAKHLKQTSSYIGGAAAGCFFLPNLSTSFIMLGAMCSLGLLNNRGQPPVVRDDNGNVGEVRSTKATTILVTIALVFGNAALFAVLGSGILTAVPAIARVLPAKLVTNVMIQVGFWFAATFFQTYNTGPGKSRLQKKGWK